MLGFSTISEAPLAVANASLLALAYLPSSTSQGFTTALFTDAQANITPSSAASTTTASALLYDSKASIVFADAVAAFDMNALLDYDAKARVTPTPVVSVSNAGALDYSAIAYINTSSVSATVAVDAFEKLDAQARATTLGTSSTALLAALQDVTGTARVVPDSTVAYLSIYIGDFADEDAQATAFIGPVGSTTNVTQVDFSAASNITPSNVVSDISASDLSATGIASVTFDSLSATIFRNLEAPTAIRFPYQDYADQYSVGRTVFLFAQDRAYTVYITEQNNTVYSDTLQGSNIVYITEQNNTVYSDTLQGSNIVYITKQNNTVYSDTLQGSNIVYITKQNNTVYIDKLQGSNTVYIAA